MKRKTINFKTAMDRVLKGDELFVAKQFYQSGTSPESIASCLGVSLQEVRKINVRAMEKVKKYLKEFNNGTPESEKKTGEKSRDIHRPWLDENGELRGDGEITLMGKDWDQETWSDYLDEVVDVRLREVTPRKYIRFISSAKAKAIYESLTNDTRCDLLRKSMDNLTEKDREIIKCFFWRNLNMTETSKVLGIDRSNVRKRRVRALKKLKTEICEVFVDSHVKKLFEIIPISKESHVWENQPQV